MHHETDLENGSETRPHARPEDGPRVGPPVQDDREVLVVVDGELDIASVPRLLELARAALEPGTRVVVLDLSAVEFLDCSGLRGLVAVRALVVGAGCVLSVPAPSPAVSRLLEWTSTSELFARPAPDVA